MKYEQSVNSAVKVKDIMTRDAVTISESESMLSVAPLFEKYGFAGFPVLDSRKKLVGILTEYDLLSHGSGVHIPTMMSILGRITLEKKDSGELKDYFKKLRDIKVKDVMNGDPLTVAENDPIEVLAGEFYAHHKVNPILVVDGAGNLTGVVSRHNLIKFFNENYLNMVLAETPRATGAMGLSRRQAEGMASRALSEISRGFTLVSKRRQFMWRLIAIVSFVIGFVAAIFWILRIVSR